MAMPAYSTHDRYDLVAYALADRMTPARPLRLTLLVWGVFAVALAVRVLHRPTSHTVFPLFAAASGHWWAGVPLYAEHPPLDYYRYPPLFAILFTPFFWCGPTLGGVLWGWLNLGVYLWGLTALTGVLPGKWSDRRRAGFLLVALAGGLPALWNGQCNALVAGLVLLAPSALTRRRWLAAGLLLATAVGLKLVPLPVALLFCALWPHLAPRFVAALAAGLLLPFLTRPAAQVVEQYHGLAEQSRRLSAERWPGFRDLWTAGRVLGRLAEGKTGLP